MDAILRIAANVTEGLVVNEKIVEKTLADYLPFLATENIMMESVKRGGDRQQLHERIRECSMKATARLKNGEDPALLGELAACPEFGMTREELEALLDPARYIGRCPEQVDRYLAELEPVLRGLKTESRELSV